MQRRDPRSVPHRVMWHTSAMSEQVDLDGSRGEGGGQILRSALALASITRRPLELRKIRARRSKPGLARQHLACVLAVAEIVDANLSGAELRSQRISFRPSRAPRAGNYQFEIGTAGSTGLVFQTVLWPLLAADGVSDVTIVGGTHNPMAPPLDYLVKTFIPVLRQCGADVELSIERHGFYPKGGGRIRARICGPTEYRPLELTQRGDPKFQRARIVTANLPAHVAEREAAELCSVLDMSPHDVTIEEVASSGPGNAVHVELGFENIATVISAFGEKGIPAERVARDAATEAHTYLAGSAPVGEHLADQLIIPLALTGAGDIRCTTPSLHTRTNIEVVAEFTGRPIAVVQERSDRSSYRMRVDGS